MKRSRKLIAITLPAGISESGVSFGELSPEPGKVPHVWGAWKEDVHDQARVHPNAPSGAGGPGMFRSQKPMAEPDSVSAAEAARLHPSAPVPLGEGDAPKVTGAKPKSAPRVTDDQPEVSLLTEKTALVDIDIKYQIKADAVVASISKPGLTTINDNFPLPVFTAPAAGKPGSMTWKGTITIITKYQKTEYADGTSCYGRGTTADDRTAGNVTLGFHESCHRADYKSYLDSISLPATPALTATMSPQEFQQEKNKFDSALAEYRRDLIADSDTNTDETGHKKADVASKGCFQHVFPA